MTSSDQPSPVELGRWRAALLVLGATTLISITAVVLATSMVFILGGTVNIVTTAIAVVGGLGWLCWARREAPRGERAVLVLAVVLVGVIAVVIAAATVDLSWDGNDYHKDAIGELRAGWNPVYSSAEQFNALPSTPLHISPLTWTWVDHYPKASWIFGAATSQVLGNIETSKAFGILIALALGLLGLGYMTARIGLRRGIAVAALLVVNPISMSQIFSNYVDGSLGDLMVIGMLILSMQLDPGWKPPRWWISAQWPALAAVLMLMVNLKFTGLLYAGFLGVAYLVTLAIRWRAHRSQIVSLALAGVMAAIVGVGVIGASSYVRNWIIDGNPLAPLFGGSTVNVLALGGQPGFLTGHGRIEAFFLSNFSASSSDGISAGLKVPFSFSAAELRAFDWVDVRIAGYGVWFGGLLIMSAVAMGVVLFRRRAQVVPFLPLFLSPMAVFSANVLLVDGSWWARYVPELSVFPVLGALALWFDQSRIMRTFGWLLVTLTALNAFFLLSAQVRQQALEWPNPPLSEQVASRGCNAVYPGSTYYTGLAFNALDQVPGVRILTESEYSAIGADGFVPASSRVWLLHPLMIQTKC